MAAFHLWTPPFRQGKTLGSLLRVVGCCHLSGLRCGRKRQPPACMGVRGPGPDHPKRARSTVESPGCPGPVSPTVAPYSPSARPHVLAIVVSLRRHGRSSVGATFDQKGPDDAGHLVGQSNGDQHFRLASQHLRKPRPRGCPAPAGLLNDGTRPNDQQAADRPFTAFRNGTEFLLATGRFLQRCQSEPGREIASGRKPLGRWHERGDCR